MSCQQLVLGALHTYPNDGPRSTSPSIELECLASAEGSNNYAAYWKLGVWPTDTLRRVCVCGCVEARVWM